MVEITSTNFQIKQIGNLGAKHPIISRLVLGSYHFLDFSNLNKNDIDDIKSILMDELRVSLTECWEVKDWVNEQSEIEFQKYLNGQKNNTGFVVEAPNIIGLEPKLSNFLRASKRYLRHTVKIINVFYQTNFDEPSCLCSWAKDTKKKEKSLISMLERTHGKNDYFVRLVKGDQKSWIDFLMTFRNADEHPEGFSGSLKIENLTLLANGDVYGPVWFRDGKTPSGVIPDLETLCENLLGFTEEVIMNLSIDKFTRFPHMIPVKISEEQRSKMNIPTKWKAGLDPQFIRNNGK